MSMVSTADSHLQCLCGAVNEQSSVLASKSFPIETRVCHCNICRRSSGALAASFAKLVGSPSARTLAVCTRYSTTQGVVHRYHCSTCGCRTFDYVENAQKWLVCSGIIERTTFGLAVDVTKITSHCHVGDTGDGGLATILGQLGGRNIPIYHERIGSGAHEVMKEEGEVVPSRSSDEDSCATRSASNRLHVACHCGKIQFQVLRPSPQNLELPHVARWLCADGRKYLGLNCVCRYDRLSLGISLASWIYVMPENVTALASDGSTNKIFGYRSSDKEMPSLVSTTESLQATFPAIKCFFSSPDCRRSFCGSCGANIFFEDEIRPACVNIAAGILRAETGCLAREWVEWDWARIPWVEWAVDQEVVMALKDHGHRRPVGKLNQEEMDKSSRS